MTTVSSGSLPFGLRSRYASANYVLPESSQSEFEAGLLELLERERPDVFLPLGNRSTFIASKHRVQLRAAMRVSVPPVDAFLAAYKKDFCAAECHKLGIPAPALYSLGQAMDVLEMDREAILVVKPDSDVSGAAGVNYVRDRIQLAAAVRECVARFHGAVIQEYIPGGAQAMHSVMLAFAGDGQLMAAFTAQKLKQSPTMGGTTVVSRSTANARLVKQVLPFFQKWRWCGVAEVELKADSRTGESKVIEINPRFPGYLRFPIECGLDFPVIVTSVGSQGEVVPLLFPSYRVGVEYRNPKLLLANFLSSLHSPRHGEGEFRGNIQDLVKAVPTACRALSDPLPWLGKALSSKIGSGRPPFLIDRQDPSGHEVLSVRG